MRPRLRAVSLFASLVPAGLTAATVAQSPDAAALVGKYCASCHNDKTRTAGVSLDRLDPAKPGENPEIWERVLRKVRSGQMPPPGLPRPAAADSSTFVAALESALDRAAAEHPNPGRTPPHRLNRAEYSNAVRDLLALDTKPGALLPVDDSGYGFDNIAGVLTMSPALLERYVSVARQVSRQAIGDLQLKPGEQVFSASSGRSRRQPRNERAADGLPFDTRGGFAFDYYFPLDAEYVLRIKLTGDGGKQFEYRAPVKAGLRTVGVAFRRESAKPELPAPGGRGGAPNAARPDPAQLDLRLDGARVGHYEAPQTGAPPEVDTVTIAGPYNPTGRGDTPSRARIFVCRPTKPADEAPCAREILATIARRAFRRPVTDSDLRPLLAFYNSGRAEGDFDNGIEKALRAVLISPDFLFRVEQDPPGAKPGSVYRLNQYELASRLSFFLWSGIPDDELLALAERSKLSDPAILRAQVRRMLADPRSDSLISNFGGQWLYLRNLASVKPDPDVFPDFDESLRAAFRQETDLFLGSVFREDRNILDLLDADYTFLNQRLAEHYGVPNVYGSQFRRVALTDPTRGGLLGQGSILTVTSYPNRTSVVQRGKWILENLLGTPPPPPPPDVPELKPHGDDGRKLTMREAMELHRANAICAGCHARMDPIGFALENYDGVGHWRNEDGGAKIDPSGKLPSGVEFQGPQGLRKILTTAYRDDFVATVTEKLMIYALGRGIEPTDKPAVRAIARQAARGDYRISALIAAIAESPQFEMRRVPE